MLTRPSFPLIKSETYREIVSWLLDSILLFGSCLYYVANAPMQASEFWNFLVLIIAIALLVAKSLSFKQARFVTVIVMTTAYGIAIAVSPDLENIWWLGVVIASVSAAILVILSCFGFKTAQR